MLKFFSDLGNKKIEEMKLKSNEGKKLKPGVRVYAKVIKKNGSNYLLSLNGDSILAKSERELQIGQLVRLKIEKITEKNELIVKIEEDNSNVVKNNNSLEEKKEELIKIKKEILRLSVEEKIYLTNTEVEELVEGLDKFHKRGKEINSPLIKALILMKKLHVNEEDIFEGLRKYYNKEVENRISIEHLLADLKKEIKYLEEERDEFSKGLNKLNELNDKQGFLAFLFGIKEFYKPISVQVKKEGLNREFSKENLNITIKLELEVLGKLDIDMNIWKKRVNMNFMFYNDFDRGIFKDLKNFEKNIEKLGYIVEEIHIGRKVEDKIGEIGNINYKI